MYGKSLQVPNSLASRTIVETPELLAVREAQRQKQPTTPTKVNSVSKQPSLSASPMKGPSKQIETRTSDGKRRITPMFIPQVVDNGLSFKLITLCFFFYCFLYQFYREAPQPFSSSSQPTFSSSTETKSKIVIEKREDIVTPNVSKPNVEKPPAPEVISTSPPQKVLETEKPTSSTAITPLSKASVPPEKTNGSISSSIETAAQSTPKVDKPR